LSALDWLRAKTKPKPKYATGGYVTGPRPGEPPLIQGGCAWPAPLTAPELPDGATIQIRGYTETTPEEHQQLLADIQAAVAPRVKPSLEHTAELTRQAEARARAELKDQICPCTAIYSKCYCKPR
jgi:hypothetical protein